jgi:SAM-dependent methyltransferase
LSLQLHQEEILANYDRLRRKPLLRRIYANFYRELAKRIAYGAGPTLEIGSGVGGMKSVVPNCISTDLFTNPGIDCVENAYALSFADQSIQNIVLFDVFHHLKYPGTALAEFHRVLKPGGRVVIFEPYPSLTGLVCYGCLHAEPLGLLRAITWMAPAGWSPSDSSYYAAQGNATRVFRSPAYRERLKGWRIAETKVLASLSYVASGGFSGPQLYPESLYPIFTWIDRLAGFLPTLFGTRLLVVLERVQCHG